ncbi:Ribosomal L28e protein family isoform 1 [Theobroma cacao]|uniref:Ribosomal L28e protein family isoform 1 n=1 Tax=Theobroma cacao TaxID=3641 RepID=A0A061GD10_THECC|nr:Ribosomal L28e protein family isoform 1 [Theobroma cacao]
MATVPGQLIWEIVKKNNSFLVKQFGRGTASVQFSKEPNNLYNLNSYKHSGLANKKTVTIQSGGKDQSVLLATTKTKKQNKPSSLLHKSVMRKEFPRMAKAVKNQVWYCLHSNSNFLKVLSCGDEAITGKKDLFVGFFYEIYLLRLASELLNLSPTVLPFLPTFPPFFHLALGCYYILNYINVADNYYRPDLTKAALARLSAVNRSLKVAKSGVKKRNRQALKIRGRK